MARTLWGNIIELMAATGLHGAMNAGVQTLMAPILARKEAQQQVLKSLLPTMGTETDPDKLGAIASKIKDISGVDLSTGAPETNAAGVEAKSSEGQALTVPKTSLADLAPGVTTTPGFIKPAPDLNAMKANLFNKLSPTEQVTAAFPKDATLQAARENLAANLLFKQQEGEANRQSRMDIATMNNETRKAIADATNAGKEDQRQFMRMYLGDKLNEAKRRGDTIAEQKEYSQFLSLNSLLQTATGDQKKGIKTQINNLIDASENPSIKLFPKFMEDVPVPGTGVNLPIVGEVGTTKVKQPIGQSATPGTAPTTETTSPYTLPKGGKMVPVDKATYDAYQKKWGLTK